MSGFEIAGVVLGAVPLIISALEYYRSGKSTVSASIKWHSQLDTLIFRLKLQYTLFYLDILELLKAARVEELDGGVGLTEAECVAILSAVKTGKEIKRFLGPLSNIFLEILGRYEDCLKQITVKIRYIRRLKGVLTRLP